MSPSNSPIYDFKVKTLNGKDFDMLALKGKVVLIFNSASSCGYAAQLPAFQELHQKYQEKGLVILGFPSDDFKQETGTEAEISEICQINVKFVFFNPSLG